MGLDIYFYKIKKGGNDVTLENAYDEAREQQKEVITKVYDNFIKSLKKSKDYGKTYENGIKKLSKLTNYPDYDLDILKASTLTINELIELKDKIINGFCPFHIAYFRKVNCIYAYFMGRMVSEMSWVSKSDIEDIIDRCEKVLNNHRLAAKLLPTQDGFFFGSTKYDDWYFDDIKDLKKQMKSIIKDYDEDKEIMFVRFSW